MQCGLYKLFWKVIPVPKVPLEYYEEKLKELVHEPLSASYTGDILCDHYLFYLKDSSLTPDMVTGLPSYLACYAESEQPPRLVTGFPHMLENELKKAIDEYNNS